MGDGEAWGRIRRLHTPLIAAVNGYALGGGCELALHCDMIVASENARFGQPEILIGIIPGAGGTQRLARVLGKYRTMEMVLTGAQVTAQELASLGLVNRVVPKGEHLHEALKLAQTVAPRPPSPPAWPKRLSSPPLKPPSKRDWRPSAKTSSCSSLPKICAKGCEPLSKNANPTSKANNPIVFLLPLRPLYRLLSVKRVSLSIPSKILLSLRNSRRIKYPRGDGELAFWKKTKLIFQNAFLLTQNTL